MIEPFTTFAAWLAEAVASELNDPNAMALATATLDARPSVRVVLLKDWDERGFVFYSNAGSRKGRELAANPFVQLDLHWKSLRRQVRIDGRAEPVSPAEADAYHASRPRASQLSAWASDQSRPLVDRASLEERFTAAEARFVGLDVPRPPYWTGWRVVPSLIEFWQDRRDRLHERTFYTRSTVGWTVSQQFP